MSDCEEIKTGKVVRIKGGAAKVEIERTPACEGCKACIFASKKTVIVTAINEAGAKLGDEVTVLPPPPKPFTAFLILFVVPIAALVAALIIAVNIFDSELLCVLFAFIGLAVGLMAVFIADRLYYSKKYVTRITSVINLLQGENTNDRS